MAQRYVAEPIGAGWWAVFDHQTGREIRHPEAYVDSGAECMGSRAEAEALAAKMNSRPNA